MAITPESIGKSGSEQGIQRAIVLAVIMNLHKTQPLSKLLYHTPNGGYRGDTKSAAIAGNNLALMGAQKGVPDLTLPVPLQGYASLYIEVKLPKGKLSVEQVEYIKLLAAAKNFVAIIDDWEVGYALIHDWLTASPSMWASRYGETGIFDPKNRMSNPEKPKRR